ncbi:PEP-CTERM sorting domain-containing protein [Rhodoferax koreense]|uniref:PEP-CTERM sorting domain-containing protein n=2 Tax=Rhodoferax koreensis TaxID=1842727 RepID=A0A1P8K3I7_9BURK|nr:PEP-CTERM sorting domain-containing protein [Rhodoferax koreense]
MACLPLSIGNAYAGPFSIGGNSTSAQTLGSGSGQTGAVADTGSLIVSGSAVAVTITGNNATLDNQGTISQTGTGRVVRDNTGVTGLMINNGSVTNASAVMKAADADVVQMAKSPASVTLNNYGQMISLNASAGGAQVVDFNAIASGVNVVNNYATGVMTAYEADAVRPGVNGVVNNYGAIKAITTTGSSSDGIDAQNNTGIQVNNLGSGTIDGGRHGITGGPANATAKFDIGVTNDTNAVIRGNNGSGINLDGYNANQTATVVNRGLISGNGVTGDGDGIDADGLVNITNTGTIRSVNAFSKPADGKAYSEGISVGGGTIVNSGTIEGLVAAGNTNAVGRGITLAGNDITSGPLAGTREGLYGNAVVTNQSGGLIRGDSDSAIVVVGAASGYTVTINNNAGATLLGGGTANAAVKTGADNDTIRNAGIINGASSGMAIDMGGGNNTLYVDGGKAAILGNVNGGTGGSNRMVVDPGAGNAFAYAGSLSNFSEVQVRSGTVTLSGASTYTGTTQVSGGTLVLDGANRLSSLGSLVMDGGSLQLTNAAGEDAQTFAGFSLLDDALFDLGLSSLTFDSLDAVVAGKTLTVLGYLRGTSLDYAFRFLGDWSTDADFLALIDNTLIDGAKASFRFDGTYTDIARLAEVPEPGTLALIILALALMVAASRRRHPMNR